MNAESLAALFASGRAVDLILALVVVEAVAIAILHRTTRRGIAPVDLLPNLLAGVGLLLALRAALVDARWPWIALCLTGALVAHVIDLARRRSPT